MSDPTVIVAGLGRLEAGRVVRDAEASARCEACDRDAELVVVLGPARVCVDCLRRGLDASSVARYRLSQEAGPLPWGKVTS
jgi:hypothetical protein